MTRRWPAVLGALAVLVASCADLQAPEPVARPAVARVWDVPASTVTVPIRVAQAQVKAWTEAAVPEVLKGDGSGQRTLSAWFLKHDWHYWWTYELHRSPLTLGFEGNRIRVTTSLTGDLSARWDTLPGDISSEVEADAGVEAALSLGTDWKVVPQTRVFLDVRRADVPIGIAWDGNFFGETISIAAPVQEALKPSLGTLGKELDRRLGSLELKPAVQSAWNDLQEPRVVPGTRDLWFSLGPRAVSVGPLVATAGSLGVDLTLEVHPTLTGSRPDTARLPLPAPTPARTTGPQVVLNLPVSLTWDQAIKATKDRWSRTEPWDVGNGGKIRVRDLAAKTDGDRVLLRVQGTLAPPWPGPEVAAVVWLGARPVWDSDRRSLKLDQLTLEVQTKDYLAKTASWLLADRWIRTLEQSLVWDLGPDLDALGAQATAALNHLSLGQNLALTATLDPVQLADFTLAEKGPEVLARVSGTASVSWVP